MSAEIQHIVRTFNYETGAAEMFCGATLERSAEPTAPGAGCAGCYVAALDLIGKRVQDLAEVVNADAKKDNARWIGWYDSVTLRLERLEMKAAKKKWDRR